MPRYFFHTEDGQCFPDEEGTELPDLSAAKRAAVQTFREILGSFENKFWESGCLRLIVRDEGKHTLFTFDLNTDASPPVQAVRSA